MKKYLKYRRLTSLARICPDVDFQNCNIVLEIGIIHVKLSSVTHVLYTGHEKQRAYIINYNKTETILFLFVISHHYTKILYRLTAKGETRFPSDTISLFKN